MARIDVSQNCRPWCRFDYGQRTTFRTTISRLSANLEACCPIIYSVLSAPLGIAVTHAPHRGRCGRRGSFGVACLGMTSTSPRLDSDRTSTWTLFHLNKRRQISPTSTEPSRRLALAGRKRPADPRSRLRAQLLQVPGIGDSSGTECPAYPNQTNQTQQPAARAVCASRGTGQTVSGMRLCARVRVCACAYAARAFSNDAMGASGACVHRPRPGFDSPLAGCRETSTEMWRRGPRGPAPPALLLKLPPGPS